MWVDFLKALIVGMMAAVPVGPVFVMAVQRTLCHGRQAGWMVGLGAAVADTIYAVAGLFALTLIQGFVHAHQGWIMVVGGVVVAWIGVIIFTRKPTVAVQEEGDVPRWSCALQGFTSAISNPGALAVMVALPAAFGIAAGQTQAPLWLLAPVIGVGELLYWTVLTALLSRYLKIGEVGLRRLSRAAGVIVCVFALVLLVRGIVLIIQG